MSTSWMLELLFYTFNVLNVSLLMRTPSGVSLQEATAGRSGFGSQESAEKSGRNKRLVCLFLIARLFCNLNNCDICYITGYLCICSSVKMSLLFKWKTKFSFSLTFIIRDDF